MRKRIRQKKSKGLNKKDMLTVTGRIKKGKIVLDEQIGVHDGKVLVTFIEEKEIQPLEPVKNFGKELQKLKLAGIWSGREITDGLAYSRELRKKLSNRNVN
ncbi:hypothetical protein [Leptospira borgpetersenii]|uniref:hypothetical protein n=1 Tax=Leptospira borgpetersenii TaxID=174 RepID=UPI00188C965C|nr:hypothetical protein [Leptospira borgpetersenii]MBF3377048.1 hypothetical protein [Leptospira borgpetersenii serovar Balcanica]